MQPHFTPSFPPSPLLIEHRYKLQLRCPDCLSDSYPVACFGMKRLTAVQVRSKVLEFAERLQKPCQVCDGFSSVLVCFFPHLPREPQHG